MCQAVPFSEILGLEDGLGTAKGLRRRLAHQIFS
jgi:hypothetical protein